ncbi:Transcription factor E2F3 [Dictyocoela muelleri]|nr:Transcription factor E2F3 [Dictyocoela muelleri]
MKFGVQSENMSTTGSSRSDNSLYVLTQKFLEFIKECHPAPVDTKEACRFLGISKRRICDITNILEGLGLLKKHSVNNMLWIGGPFNKYHSAFDEISEWGKERLLIEDKALDEQIHEISETIEKITEDQTCIENSFVTYNDLVKIANDRDMLVFAIKAPVDTFVENKKIDGGYMLELMTKEGKIEAYYVSDKNND